MVFSKSAILEVAAAESNIDLLIKSSMTSSFCEKNQISWTIFTMSLVIFTTKDINNAS